MRKLTFESLDRRLLLAATVGKAVHVDGDLYESFAADPDYDVEGDVFGIKTRDDDDLPSALRDNGRSNDSMGIIKPDDFDPFFAVVDTKNNVGEDLNRASWTFNIEGCSILSISADFAAMGDFENSDSFIFYYSIDGAERQVLFESSVDEDSEQEYLLSSGSIETLADPLLMNERILNNDFQKIEVEIENVDDGTELEITFEAIADGGTEVFAFRNLTITSTSDVIDEALAGDHNDDGRVDQADLDLVLLNWGSNEAADDWQDGFVDQNELDEVLLNWGAVV